MNRPWSQYEGSQCRPAIAERAAVRAEMERRFREREEAEEEAGETVTYVTPTEIDEDREDQAKPATPGPCECEVLPVSVTGDGGWRVWCPSCAYVEAQHEACSYYSMAHAVAEWESRMGR